MKQLNESPPNNRSLNEMTRDELAELAFQLGFHQDEHNTKQVLIELIELHSVR
jgi:hypothetical protein